MSEPTGRPRTAVISATVAAVALVGGWTWAAAVQPGGFDQAAETISALAASGHAPPLGHDDGPRRDRARPRRHGVGARARTPAGARPAGRRRRRDAGAGGGPAALAQRVVGRAHRPRRALLRPPRGLAVVRGATRGSPGARVPRRAPRRRRHGPRGGLPRARPGVTGLRPARARRRGPHRRVAPRHGGRHVVVGRAPHRLAARAPRARRRRAHRGLRSSRASAPPRSRPSPPRPVTTSRASPSTPTPPAPASSWRRRRSGTSRSASPASRPASTPSRR